MSIKEQAKALDVFKTSVEDLAVEQLLRLEEERTMVSAALGSLNEQIKQVSSILRSVNGKNPGTKQKAKRERKRKQYASDFAMGQERETEMINWLTGNKGNEITIREVQAQFPNWSSSYCNMSLKMLRETGVIRLAATSGATNVYRTLL
jgi:hypothetical protein